MPAIFDLPTVTLLVIVAGFVAGALVKGVLGAGLPAVGLPIMVLVITPAEAVALFVVPVMISNIWQIFQGGHFREAIRRYWPFLAALVGGVWIGAGQLTAADPQVMAVFLGVLVVVSTVGQIVAGKRLVAERAGRWVHPLAGGLIGVASGATGVFTPTIVYFAALRLPKDLFVSQLALIAMIGSMTMYGRLFLDGGIGADEMAASSLALAPTAVGLVTGFWIRERLSERAFRTAVWTGLILLGLGLIGRGLT